MAGKRHKGHRARRARRFSGGAKWVREERQQFPGYELSASLGRDLDSDGAEEPDASPMRQTGSGAAGPLEEDEDDM